MIQGHTLDVLLSPAYRQGILFEGWLFLRGLTAPVFFILSGVSFTLSSVRGWDDYVQPSWKLLRRLGRFAFFVLLGYAMHLPALRPRDFQHVDAAGWQGWFQVDVLECIGVTLIALQVLVLLTRTPERFAQWSLGLSGGVILLTPLIWAVDWARHLPMSIASYLSAHTGSLFPLFPWSAYVLFGGAVGYALRCWSSDRWKPIQVLTAAGLAMIVLGASLSRPVTALYANLDFWRASPNVFLIRAGCVFVLLSFLTYLTQRLTLPQGALRALAAESLTIYFVHVCILYGSIWNPGLRQAIGSTLTPLPTLGWIVALVLSMMSLGWVWNRIKRTEPRRSYLVRFAVFALALLRPWG
jgi:uncharacterized membrane protein